MRATTGQESPFWQFVGDVAVDSQVRRVVPELGHSALRKTASTVAKHEVVEFVLENSLYEEQRTIRWGLVDHLLHEDWVIDHLEPAVLRDADTGGRNGGRSPLIEPAAESREEGLVRQEAERDIIQIKSGLCGSGHVDSERAEVPGYIYSVAEAGSEVQREVVKGMSGVNNAPRNCQNSGIGVNLRAERADDADLGQKVGRTPKTGRLKSLDGPANIVGCAGDLGKEEDRGGLRGGLGDVGEVCEGHLAGAAADEQHVGSL